MSAEKISYELKRFAGIKRDYTDKEVERLRGSIKIEYSLCKNHSEKLWKLLNTEAYVNTLGSLSGNQAVQHAKAGLKAIYLSGWQVAADANTAGEMYPDQSLYPYDSAPKLVESMNNSLIRADQIQHMEMQDGDMKREEKVDYMLPIIADGEAGFGGPLNVFELTKKFIRAGAAVSKMNNGEKYVCIARTVEKGIGRFGQAKSVLSIGLGCEAKYAKDFVYTENVNINDKSTEIPIGVSCRTCDRLDCSQRAFPPLHKKFDVDLNTRGVSVYVSDNKS